MEYFFEVTLDYEPDKHILINARDCIDAGLQVEQVLLRRGIIASEGHVIEVTRTKIAEIIDY